MDNILSFNGVQIGESRNVVTIAEAAVEHLGSLNVAQRMAVVAKKVGADFIKYQMHLPDEEMIPDSIKFWGGSLDDVLESYNLSIDDHKELIEFCKKIEIQYLCTPFSPAAVEVLDRLGVSGYKTGSGELTNLPLMKRICQTQKPVIVSTGMATMEEIEETVSLLKQEDVDFALMNCTSLYPPPYELINLNLIPTLKEKFDTIVGHSDHTPDIWTALGAVSLGAKIIEKHFTLNRSLEGPDYEVSLEPAEFSTMVEGIRKLEKALGSEKKIHPGEEEVREWAHHSVVSICDIPRGSIITREMIGVKRPGRGIPAKHLEELYGFVAKRDIEINSILQWDDVEKSG